MLIVQEDEPFKGEMEEELTLVEVFSRAEVSLNSTVGLTNLKMLRARGSVGEQPVVVLIDSSIKHNPRRRCDNLGFVSVGCWCNICAINMAPKVFSREEKFKLKSPGRVIVACILGTHWCNIHCK